MPKKLNTGDSELLLSAALEGLLLQKKRIEEQIVGVRARLGRRGGKFELTSSNGTGAEAAKRNLSPEARKRIAAAQKRRWAEYRKNAGKDAA